MKGIKDNQKGNFLFNSKAITFLMLLIAAFAVGSAASKVVCAAYSSNLPVMYIDTDDGKSISSKSTYKGATMRLEGNSEFTDEKNLYNGKIEIKGRGNSTWAYSKKPYRFKLDKKTDLLGLGKSKAWVLLANAHDKSLIKTKLALDIGEALGLVSMNSTYVDLVLNGKYVGNYQLTEAIKIEGGRVDIQDWEEAAEDIAKAIANESGLAKADQDKLETQLKENLDWITSNKVTYNKKTYTVSDYYEFPRDASGNIDTTGGFLIENDHWYDEESKFKTSNGVKFQFKSPEYIKTNSTMWDYIKKYMQALEDCIRSNDKQGTYQGKAVSYVDLVDIESFVKFFMVEGFMMQWDVNGSVYLYKDLGEKVHYGPLWDFDRDYSTTDSLWLKSKAPSWPEKASRDGYYMTKLIQYYQQNKDYFQNLVKDGGYIDELINYIGESGKKDNSSFASKSKGEKDFLKKRVTYLNKTLVDLPTVAKALGAPMHDSVSVSYTQSAPGSITFTGTCSKSSASKLGFYLNAHLIGTVDLKNKAATLTVNDLSLLDGEGEYNCMQVRAMDSKGKLLSSGKYTNFIMFSTDDINLGN